MSMREYPSSGYIVPIEQLEKFLTEREKIELNELKENRGWEDVQIFLCERLPDKILLGSHIFCPTDEDTVDEPMEIDKWYVIYDEDDLFVKTKTKGHLELERLGIEPKFANWSIYG